VHLERHRQIQQAGIQVAHELEHPIKRKPELQQEQPVQSPLLTHPVQKKQKQQQPKNIAQQQHQRRQQQQQLQQVSSIVFFGCR
jgi:hypothetical protein